MTGSRWAGSVADTLEALRFGVRTQIARYPRLYLPLARWKYRSNDGAQAVGDETDIVIEGFPRSANTFAVVAFAMAQDTPVNIAHHLHAPAQIIEAIRRRKPIVLLLREPYDAVRSWLVRKPEIGPLQAYRTYIDFYEPCVGALDHIVVAPFEEVTADFGAVIRAVNQRYDLEFGVFEHSPANVERCYAIIEEMNRRKFGGGLEIQEAGVARPSPARDELKKELDSVLADPGLNGIRLSASALYDQIRGHAGRV